VLAHRGLLPIDGSFRLLLLVSLLLLLSLGLAYRISPLLLLIFVLITLHSLVLLI
jgi:hypothetical protein